MAVAGDGLEKLEDMIVRQAEATAAQVAAAKAAIGNVIFGQQLPRLATSTRWPGWRGRQAQQYGWRRAPAGAGAPTAWPPTRPPGN